jgi:NADH-quinone oxidoreductase subunit L
MRNYGGLRKKVPLTFWAMMIGTLAITGVGIPLTHIGFAGFLSKDAVIESAFVGSQYAFWMLVIAAFMTSFYSWRLMFMTFFGTPRGDHHAHDHAHESPKVMLIPLGILALGAVFSGMLWYKVFFGDEAKLRSWFGMPAGIEHAQAGHGSAGEAAAGDHAATATAEDHAATATPMVEAAAEDHMATAAADAVPAAGQAVPAPVQGALFFGPDNQMIHKAHGVPDWVKVSPFAAMILGLALAFQFYIRRPDLPGRLAANQRPLYLFLLNKWYFDEVYEFLFVRPAKWLGGFLWKRGDGAVIDGSINGLAMRLVPFFTRLAGRAQTGYVFSYAFAMVLGIAVLVTWMTLFGGAE